MNLLLFYAAVMARKRNECDSSTNGLDTVCLIVCLCSIRSLSIQSIKTNTTSNGNFIDHPKSINGTIGVTALYNIKAMRTHKIDISNDIRNSNQVKLNERRMVVMAIEGVAGISNNIKSNKFQLSKITCG